MTNLLQLSRYDRLGASSRIRMMQYRPWLEAVGITVEEAPFFDTTYINRLYEQGSKHSSTGRAFLHRARDLRRKRNVDLVWIEKEALPFLPWTVERALLPQGVPIVSDYDDAVFHRYDKHLRAAVRLLLGRKIGSVMAASDVVFAGNPYLAEHARSAGSPHVEIVPSVVDAEHYRVRRRLPGDGPVRVGWIGSPSTWTEYMAPVVPVICTVLAPHGGIFRVVGAGPQVASSEGVEFVAWSEEREVAEIQNMDIGVMPLDDSPWARGKCGYKLIQYMACGLPVVASPVGVNMEIVEHGVNGFLASTDDEWHEALDTLLRDPDLRARMGAAGRRKVETSYSLQVWGPRVAALLKAVAERRA